ncbi:MAG: hypothetical protein QOJ72_402 [Nocardioidaceae bacterium]|jgi:hypothetical protein|nr:hypothetical protein [Nocardioidaceae bacterium]
MRTRARAIAVVVAGLMLAACGNIHPGAAAVVDGRSISMKSLDKTAKIYCHYALAAAKANGATKPSNVEVRRQAISGIVTAAVARKVAAAKGITPKPQTYVLTGAQHDQIAKQFPSNTHDVIKTIEDAQEMSEISVRLGELSTGTTRTADNASQLAEVGQGEIVKAFRTYHVHFAPRFGLNDKLKAVASTGSLSVADRSLDKSASNELPAAQHCA